MTFRKILKRSIYLSGVSAFGYGYYLSKVYLNTPYYSIPSSMELNQVVETYKKSDDKYFAYCDTFTTSVDLDAALIKKLTKKDLTNLIAKTFFDSPVLELYTKNSSKQTSDSSTLVTTNSSTSIVSFFEFISDYGFPYRDLDTRYQELHVELSPLVNPDTRIIESYAAKLYLGTADLYNKNSHDGKILPVAIQYFNRFKYRVLLSTGAQNVSKVLGLKQG